MSTGNVRPNRILKLRKAARLSYADLASRCEVSENTIRRWEKGIHPIPDEQKITLAAMFSVSVSFLMGWEENPLDTGRLNGPTGVIA